MKGGEDVVEEVFYIRAETVEIALRGPGQIGATLYSVAADSEAVVEEVGGEKTRKHRCSIRCVNRDDYCKTKLPVVLPCLPQMLRFGQPHISLEHMRPIAWTRAIQQATIRFPIKPAIIEMAGRQSG